MNDSPALPVAPKLRSIVLFEVPVYLVIAVFENLEVKLRECLAYFKAI